MKLLILLSVLALGGAVIQEIVLHETEDETGNFYTFREGISNMTAFPFLNKIVRLCHNSRMIRYIHPNYAGDFANDPTPGCFSYNHVHKSMRFFGNRNTSIDAVTLYSRRDYQGEEVYVDRSPFGGIQENMLTLGYSGQSAWTVFEGSNFEGKFACLESGHETYSYNVELNLKMTGVRSLVKGCLTQVTSEMRRQLQKDAFRNQISS